jgi:23S rRNA pseudouridine955/2504/2580 synthase
MNVSLRVVTDDEADIRLDRWFRRHFPAITQGAIQKLCRTGQVRVDGHRIEAAARLQPGQTVRVPPIRLAEPVVHPIIAPDAQAQAALENMVLYRDDQVIVLNKPYGLPVQGGPGILRHLDGMLDGLRFGHPDRPRLVHRLDRDTSGVLVLARSPGVAARLAAAFRGRDVEKTYWAVVAGRPVPVSGRIELDMVRIGGKRGERAMVATPGDPDAAHSITDYRTLDHAARRLAWLELSPLTGRTHQLRVHCMTLGTPILGDDKYGIERNTDERGPRDIAFVDTLSDQLHLHARRIRLPHPEGGTLEVAADLPDHMRETFATIGFTAEPAPAPLRLKR